MASEYDKISVAYDEAMGKKYLNVYLDALKDDAENTEPNGLRVLDLGCGTGTLLSLISRNNRTVGIDISPEMVSFARRKDPHTTYIVGDITDFHLDEKFDYVFCTFDTINHLKDFESWKKTFSLVSQHLEEGGKLMFDFNTVEKFHRIDRKTLTTDLSVGTLTMKTTLIRENQCRWDMTLRINGQESTATITEISFSTDTVLSALKKLFTEVKTTSGSDKEDRIFITAIK